MRYDVTNDPLKPISIVDDKELKFSSPMIQFSRHVSIKDCVINEFDIYGAYFFEGLLIERCKVNCSIVWTAGGHNEKPIIFRSCEFLEFVDFEDCRFDSDLILDCVKFRKGTNLLGNKMTPVEVGFERPPQLSDVEGDISVDTYEK